MRPSHREMRLRPALRTKEWHEALAGLVDDGGTTPSGAPKNPLQLGATFWHFRHDEHVQGVGKPRCHEGPMAAEYITMETTPFVSELRRLPRSSIANEILPLNREDVVTMTTGVDVTRLCSNPSLPLELGLFSAKA